ncbi:MAG: hypothetical protein GX591_19250, partial [Planctomycetes bacterium]|nr:hypothetical protein [Planctomycetota bacterium]
GWKITTAMMAAILALPMAALADRDEGRRGPSPQVNRGRDDDRGGRDGRGGYDRDRYDRDRYDRDRYDHGRRPDDSNKIVVRFGSPTPVVRQVWVAGRYETRTQQVLVEAGHYETRTESVLVQAGRWETRYIPAVEQTWIDASGRIHKVIVSQGRTERVWIEPVYTTRTVRVWVPDRYETRTVTVYVPGYYTSQTTYSSSGFSIGGVIRW